METERLKRLEFLQRQAQELLEHERRERNETRIKAALTKIRDYYTGKIRKA